MMNYLIFVPLLQSLLLRPIYYLCWSSKCSLQGYIPFYIEKQQELQNLKTETTFSKFTCFLLPNLNMHF